MKILTSTILLVQLSLFTLRRRWILEKDHKGNSISSGNYRKIIAILMEDDPELVQKIRNKEFKFKDTRQIVRSYNEYMSSHSSR
jgi:hypothetical protein